MATYYVIPQVGGASDSNNGTSTSTPWLTIDKAANTVAAGDTVHIAGNWTYKELVTMDTSGTSGNQISYLGDTKGEYTGYAGAALISSFNDPGNTSITRSYCWNLNGKEFITIKGFVMIATDSCIYDAALAGNRAYEGVIIEDCALQGNAYGIDLDFNAGVTPTADGLIVRNCKASQVLLRHENNVTENINLKLLLLNIEVHKYLSNAAGTPDAGFYISGGATNTFSVGGITIANCTVYGGANGVKTTYIKNTTNPAKIFNFKSYSTGSAVAQSLGTTAAVECYATVSMNDGGANTSTTDIGQYNTTKISEIFGGFHDFTVQKKLGYTPYVYGEAFNVAGFTSHTLAYGQSANYLPTEDIYGNPRGMGSPNDWNKFHFDASDDAVSDPNASWTNEANIFDDSATTSALVGTTDGTESSKYVFAGGTSAPSSGGTIFSVLARVRYSASNTTSRTLNCKIYTDGLAESLLSFSETSTDTNTKNSEWRTLTAPSGGWSWATLQALEVKLWQSSGGSSLNVFCVQLAVVTSDGHSDLGAIESRTGLQKESTTVRTGSFAGRFDRADFKDFWIPVNAASTTVSVYGRFDSNYVTTLSKPKLTILNIPGVADQTDTMTESADTWEKLSCTFTPTSTGCVRVRISSHGLGVAGKCFFDDFSRT
jgi:hypothetical protein